jgi:hypothetical protein
MMTATMSAPDTSTSVNWDLVERARSLDGIKGHVTNIDPAVIKTPDIVIR